MFKLIESAFKRIMTAVTNPFRMIIVSIQKLFNINVITAKLIAPLSKKVKSLIVLKPQSREDYYTIGKHWVYKKLFLTLVLMLCAGVLIYFTMFAPKVPPSAPTASAVTTNVSYKYNDMKLSEFSGVANIKAADGKTIYTGDIDAGMCKGIGSLYGHDGKLLYTGEFDQNKYNGKGISYYPSGKIKYEGTFANNLCDGEGSAYSADGNLVYTGGFLLGAYSGAGKEFTAESTLLYEGGFSEGKHHGVGTLFYEDGGVNYKGDFFAGAMQGKGELYDNTGKLLYVGDMYDNAINYRALVHSTLADVEAAFAETPRIFYTDTDSAFVYEQAGVIVTTNSRVLVDTWEKPSTKQDGEAKYYIPGTQDSETVKPVAATRSSGLFEAEPLLSASNLGYFEAKPLSAIGNLKHSKADNAKAAKTAEYIASEKPFIMPLEWFVSGGGDVENSGGAAGAGGTPSGGASSSMAPPSASSAPPASTPPGVTVVVPNPKDDKPDFVEKNNTLFFEIDKDVWQSEADLDKTKVQIKKITVFNSEIAKPNEKAVEFKENSPASMEDCVAIDFIRQTVPTAFPQVMFEIDNQNRLFVKLSNINYAAEIVGKAYLYDALTYRYFYPDKENTVPLFFSVER
ncbi:MAG: hypothetical protein RR349_02870 [Oscillospiraceae bacterium]